MEALEPIKPEAPVAEPVQVPQPASPVVKKINPLIARFMEQSRSLNVPNIKETRIHIFISSMSVRYKIAGTLILTLALAIASLGWVTFKRQERILQTETRKRATVLVQHLANIGKEALLTKQELGAFSVIKDLQNHAGVVYAMVLDSTGKVFIHNFLNRQGQVLSGDLDKAALDANGLLFQETMFAEEPVLDASLPIVSKNKNIRIGTARVGLSQTEMLEAIHKQKMVFVWISLTFVGIGLVLSFALARVLTRPIYTLSVGMKIVSQGDLSQQVAIESRDEIGKLAEMFNQMIFGLREKLHMEKYLSNSAIQNIRQNRDTTQLRLGGEKKRVTALFSDVRGFTSMSEKMEPEEVVEVLNVYLNFQSKVIHQHGGAVDKFVGDEVMAIFEGEEQELNAVRSAVEIQNYCKTLNWARTKAGKSHMLLGIGLNCGEVVMGNMGSEDQMNYTVIGDNINLAARLCSAAKPGQVVVSKAVSDALGDAAKCKALPPVSVKGKDKPIEICEILDVKGASREHMRRTTALEILWKVRNSQATPQLARTKNMGPGGCVLELDSAPDEGLKVEVMVPFSQSDRQLLHGTVQHVRMENGRFLVGIGFEALPEPTQRHIIEWVHQIESRITDLASPLS